MALIVRELLLQHRACGFIGVRCFNARDAVAGAPPSGRGGAATIDDAAAAGGDGAAARSASAPEQIKQRVRAARLAALQNT
jgi:hypothetical protein